MELSTPNLSILLGPLAAFQGPGSWKSNNKPDTNYRNEDGECADPSLDLDPCPQSSWRLDGIDRDGQRFFAVPTFMINSAPLRIDVCIPALGDQPRHSRRLLKSEALIYTSGQSALRLPISQHVLRALELWSSQIPDFKSQYTSLPFGSLVHVENIDASVEKMSISLAPQYNTEQAMLAVPPLQTMWATSIPVTAWPPSVELDDLYFQRQLHETISVVRAPAHHGNAELVFKSLVRDQRHLYHELRMLLTMKPHPNLIGRPLGVVVHRCRFGGKRGVCGFLLPYYCLGTLADALDAPIKDKLRWARQITNAMMHLSGFPGGFYPDLRPDNVVLSSEADGVRNAVLLDLEQRGGWFSWSPPEIAYLEYVEVLATRLKDATHREEFSQLLSRCLPEWTVSGEDDQYRNVDGGFSASWLAWERHRRACTQLQEVLEKAQVFLLGKLLWCMFEGEQFLRCGLDHDVLQENCCGFVPPRAFPEFRKTPPELRTLIRSCTLGAPEWGSPGGRKRPLILRQGKLVLAKAAFTEDLSTAHEIHETTSEWWSEEIRRAKEFMEEMEKFAKSGGETLPLPVLDCARARPSFQDVLSGLCNIEKRYPA
jgi:hypothetical protein